MDAQELVASVTSTVDAILSTTAYTNLSEEDKLKARNNLTTALISSALENKHKPKVKPTATPTEIAEQIAHTLNNQLNIPPSAPTKKADLTLNELADGVPIRTQKDIDTALGKPLANHDKLPYQQDLTPFFQRVERVINGLSVNFDYEMLQECHIQQLAPLILGQATWDSVSNNTFHDWSGFKAVLTKKYGLNKNQIKDAFFSMTRQNNEDPNYFIMRVELKRKQYNFDKDTCFLVFKKQLPLAYCQKLDEVKDLIVTFDESGTDFEIDWDSIVRRAERFVRGNRLAPNNQGRAIKGFDRKVYEEDPELGSTTIQQQTFYANEEQPIGCFAFSGIKCHLCTGAGRDTTVNHTVEDCWGNPWSEKYRKSIYDQRLLEYLRAGKPIPDMMKIYQNKSEEKWVGRPYQKPENDRQDHKPAKVNQFSHQSVEQFTNDLQALLGEQNADVSTAIQDALSANFNIQVAPLDHVPDPAPIYMFSHQEESSNPEQQLIATTHTEREANLTILKKYIDELGSFDINELQEVLQEDFHGFDDEDMGDNDSNDDTSEAEEGDEKYNSDEDEEDKESKNSGEQDDDQNVTLLELAKKFRSQAIKQHQTRAKKNQNKSKDRKKKSPTTGERLERLKFMFTLLQAIAMKKNVRSLVLNHALESAYEQGDTIRVLKGSDVKQITRSRLLKEREIYENTPVDDSGAAENQIKLISRKNTNKSHKRQANNLVKEYLENISEVLQALVNPKTSELSAAMTPIQDGQQLNPLEPPKWAKDLYSYNALGTISHTLSHYIGHVIIKDVLIEALFDTCGARSMIDRATAEALGFKIEVATKDKHFGSFFGPGSHGENPRSTYYYGRVKGPIQVTCGRGLNLEVEELKVVEHFEPLIIMGTDVLTDKKGKQDTKFCYVGLHPENRQGVLVLRDSQGLLREVPLASWPVDSLPTRKTTKVEHPNAAKLDKLKLKNRSRTGDNTNTKAAGLLALIKGQGKRL